MACRGWIFLSEVIEGFSQYKDLGQVREVAEKADLAALQSAGRPKTFGARCGQHLKRSSSARTWFGSTTLERPLTGSSGREADEHSMCLFAGAV